MIKICAFLTLISPIRFKFPARLIAALLFLVVAFIGVERAMMAQAYELESVGWVDVNETPKLLTCQDWLRI